MAFFGWICAALIALYVLFKFFKLAMDVGIVPALLSPFYFLALLLNKAIKH